MCIAGVCLALCHRTKISGPRSISPHLANFQPRFLYRSDVTLETAAPPPPPAILDPGTRAHRRLIPGPRAHHCLDPSLGVCCCHPLPQALGHRRATAIDLDSASLGAHHRRQPRPHLPLRMLLPSSSTPTSLGIKP
jgi:hypothetical protein